MAEVNWKDYYYIVEPKTGKPFSYMYGSPIVSNSAEILLKFSSQIPWEDIGHDPYVLIKQGKEFLNDKAIEYYHTPCIADEYDVKILTEKDDRKFIFVRKEDIA